MRRTTGLLLAIAILALLTTSLLPSPQAQPVNRSPHPILGPDQVVRDSAATCTTSPPTGCTRIDLNFNQSWDPDPGDTLQGATSYSFTYTTNPPTPASTCDFVAPPNPVAGNTPFRFARVAGAPGKYYTYAPAIPSPQVSRCTYALTVTVNDGHPVNCCATSRINITVLNDAEPPRFDCSITNSNQCVATALQMYSFNSGMRGSSGSGFSTRGKVNIVDQRTQAGPWGAGLIWFRAEHVTDDRAVASVEVYLDMVDQSDEVTHRLVVSLHKDCDAPTTVYSVDCNPYAAGREDATWNGTLKVDTPALITGSYTVWARAFDRDGYNSTFPMGKATLEVESPEGDCHPLVASTGALPPCIKLNRAQTASNIPGVCFANEADPFFNANPPPRSRLSFALGHGETLRPIIQGPNPVDNEPGTQPPRPYFLADPNLLLWKVTYQNCIESDVQLGQCAGHAAQATCALYGPEVELESPYFMALDTLFNAATPIDQDVYLRAYDRLGHINGTAFHLVTDTSRPAYLIDRPDITYSGIPFQFNVLVHDRVDTEVDLHVSDFERGLALDNLTTSCYMVGGLCTGTSPPPGNVTAGGPTNPSRVTVGQLNVVRVPRLNSAVAYDVKGPHDGKAPCSYLFDSDNDGVLDSVFNPRVLVVTDRLLATQNAAGTFDDYVIDTDGDGQLTPGETLIVGSPSGKPADANRCNPNVFSSLAVQEFLSSAETQIFSYSLIRHAMGDAPYRLAIKDLVFNNDAAPSCPPACSGVDAANNNLTGKFTTVAPLIDASITSLKITKGPFLPGDAVYINATLEQHSSQVPEPHGSMLYVLDEKASFFKNGLADCPKPGASVGPTLKVLATCQFLTGPELSFLASFIAAYLGFNAEPQTQGCPASPDLPHVWNVCTMRPDTSDPDMRVAYPPGVHEVLGFVYLQTGGNDTDLSNNLKTGSFEVYLGRVVAGMADRRGRADASSTEYYIRAGTRGHPLLPCKSAEETNCGNGAVRLAADGTVADSYPLNFTQDPELRYGFSPDNGTTQLYWDPAARLSVDKPSVCHVPNNSTIACQRPVTVIAPQATTTTTTKASPDTAIALPIVLAAAACIGRRRRA